MASGDQTEGRLVFDVRQSRLVMLHLAGVFRGPHLGRADDVLLPQLLLVAPGQGVTRQGGQAVVRVAGRGGSWRRERDVSYTSRIQQFSLLYSRG